MARASQVKNYYTFAKGLLTDASPLTYPEGASLDEENCQLNIDGSRKRRKGLEGGDENTISVEYTSQATSFYNWEGANNKIENSFSVVQYGRYILFFKQQNEDLGSAFQGTSVISGPSSLGSVNSGDIIDLDDIKTTSSTTADVDGSQVDISFGNGHLFIVGKYIEPIYVVYDDVNDNFSYYQITIRTRDLEGTDYTSGTDYNVFIDSNPSSLSSEHLYNLLNQGWTNGRITQYRASRGDYPSNSEIWHTGYYINTKNGKRYWAPGEVDNFFFGNTHAPKGHFLRNTFDTTQSFTFDASVIPTTVSYNSGTTELTFDLDEPHGISGGSGEIITFRDTVIEYSNGLTFNLDGNTYTEGVDLTIDDSDTITITETLHFYDYGYPAVESLQTAGYIEVSGVFNPNGNKTDMRPAAVAFYAGRVWYSGVEADYLSGKIMFSQIIENVRQYGFCYQTADPTSEEINDLVATDGGVISIPEMGVVLKMVIVGSNLIVFADNGVWQVSGETGSFTATDFSIRRLLSDKISARDSIVNAEGTLFFWSDSGIYMLSPDEISGYLTPKNLSTGRIQNEFNTITKKHLTVGVQGIYNPTSKIISWCYTNDPDSSSRFNRILNLDLSLQAFYKYTIGDTEKYLLGGNVCFETTDPDKKVQLFCISGDVGAEFSWHTFTNKGFFDFDSEYYTSFVETGHETLGDTIRDKQATFIECYFKRTEDGYEDDGSGNLIHTNPSSCKLTAKWEWSDSTNSGRQHGPFQVYRFRRNYIPSGVGDNFDYGFEVVQTSTKIRGKGKSLRLRFESEQGKDFHLLGWSIPYTAEGNA